jgi:hypothetical protein
LCVAKGRRTLSFEGGGQIAFDHTFGVALSTRGGTERVAKMLDVVSTLGLLVLVWALTVLLVPNKHA